jgi:CopG family transcriptional regulator, nickel-responsive regulator
LQHDHSGQVVASMHVHLDHDRCLEVLVLRGTGAELRKLAASLRGIKGVHTGELTLAETAETPIRGKHSHDRPHGHPH